MLLIAALVAMLSMRLTSATTSCVSQTIDEPGIIKLTTLGLDLRNTSFRSRSVLPRTRSIIRCRSDIEVLDVPERAVAYDGVWLGGIVTIVETEEPLVDTASVQKAVPACTGIFVSETQVISSAHCVYHQRQDADDAAHWIYGDDGSQQTYLYAIAGRVSASDDMFDVYPLQLACIPQSYIDAEDEAVTSEQGNDIAIFSTSFFKGAKQAIATLDDSVSYDVPRQYLLPQYPSDVDQGTRLVIDSNEAPIERNALRAGWFETVDLASWSGSSGGPIVDVSKSRERGQPVVVAVLMSSGWTVCDSGIVKVTKDVEVVGELLQVSKGGSGVVSTNSGDSGLLASTTISETAETVSVEVTPTATAEEEEEELIPFDDGFVPLVPPLDLSRAAEKSRANYVNNYVHWRRF